MEWIRNLVVFRNSNHLFYFVCTFPVAVMYVLTFIYSKTKGEYVLFVPVSIVVHLMIMVKAIHIVLIMKEPSEVFSFDCIWYNGTLALTYIILFSFALYYR
ncbi:MAG: hypothetical protein ACWGQW_11205, partial [bacterium]